ncbi:MAG TPA: phosphate ABC transporter permease subunit PstC [Candidatus Faeciplasma pullistercoris]|uniref:Phosphate transport system permease protein n=1 Tax=Candidatus Faeciplasma pullistercoris TaxID=2840800 RepID=A0A9D1GUN6_9FIRM|nr:phosphate ABC transporter permease subunit PstC [Candidatus Faeciplasma pullistercoris]
MKKIKYFLRKAGAFVDKLMSVIFTACGFIAIAFVLVISIYLIVSGIPAISEIGLFDFLFGTEWDPANKTNPLYGILPIILTSILGTLGAIVIGVPIGLMCSVFLSKKSKGIVSGIMGSAVDLLAGIPSVVYGLVGMIYVVPFVRETFDVPGNHGANLLSAIIVLSVMILPSVISMSTTSIKAVPKEYEEASLALGANPTETIFKVTIPAAKSGILAAIVLGTGRAIGEAMAVMMVAGNVANMPNLFDSVMFLTTTVASGMGYSSGLYRQALFSVALVLFIFIMIINFLLNLFKRKGKNK